MPAWSLLEFARRYGALDADSLRDRVATGFLLLGPTVDEAPEATFETVGAAGGSASASGLEDFVVHALITDRGDEPTFMITVGRSTRNDVALDSGAISKFHAYLRWDPNREVFSLVDAGSTNGTRVDDDRLPPNEPRQLEPGCSVRFGDAFSGTFHDFRSMPDHLRLVRLGMRAGR